MDIPKHYSLVQDHEKHFEVHDSRDGKRFKIAKKDLHPAHQIKIMKMQKFDEGGGVKPVQAGASSVMDSVPEDAPTQAQYSLPPVDQPIGDRMASLAPTQGVGVSDKQDLAIPTQQDQATANPMVNPMKEYEAAFETEKQGAQKQFEAQSLQANEQAKAYQKEQQDLEAMNKDHQTRMQALNDRSTALFDQASKGEIDPDHYWKTKDSHAKARAAIGMLLSGLSGSSHNMAWEALQTNINRDIDAQKANMAHANNLFRMNMEMTNNEQEAHLRTKADMLSLTAARINLSAAKAGTPMAEANKNFLLSKIGMQQAQIHQQLATFGISQQAYTQGVPAQVVPLLPPEQQKKMVRLPNGYMADAGSEKNATEYNEQTAAYVPLMQDLNELKSLNTAGGFLDPASRQKAEALQRHIVTSLNDLAKSHRISESDIGFQKGQLSDPTSIFNKLSENWNAATEQIQSSLTRKMDAVGKQYVPAYSNMKQKQQGINFKKNG